MRGLRILFIIAAGLMLVTGCVTTGEYEARLADIESLQRDNADLDARLKAAEDRLGQEAAARSVLVAELAKTRAEREELQKNKQSLTEANSNLNYLLNAKQDELAMNVTALQSRLGECDRRIQVLEKDIRERDARIEELKATISGLSQEKSKAIEEKEKAIAELKKTYNNLVAELNEEIKKGEIEVTQLRDKLSLSMVEQILFDSGSAQIKKHGKEVLVRVADILKKVQDKQIRIEGHTDNVPISQRLTGKFPTNWELSTARATTVVRFLVEKGVDPSFLSASGYSEYKPVSSNETKEGKARNRRIEIVLIPLDVDRITPAPK